MPIAGSPFQTAIRGFAYSVVVHPSGSFLYVSFPQSQEIAAWSINTSTGSLSSVPGSPFPSGLTSGDAPNTLLVTPSGGYLYALSGGKTVFGYSIDANSGSLSPIHGSPFAERGHRLSCDRSLEPVCVRGLREHSRRFRYRHFDGRVDRIRCAFGVGAGCHIVDCREIIAIRNR